MPRKDLEEKYKKLCELLRASMKKAGLNFKEGLENCIYSKIQEIQHKPKLVGLETPDEQDDDLNLFLNEMNLKENFNPKELSSIYRNLLDGDPRFFRGRN